MGKFFSWVEFGVTTGRGKGEKGEGCAGFIERGEGVSYALGVAPACRTTARSFGKLGAREALANARGTPSAGKEILLAPHP